MALATEDRRFNSVAPRLGFVGGFDGFRGIGVVLVLFAHIFPEHTESFQPIVDGFFVISAFLIMSLLFQEHRQNGRLDLKKFYARRAIRLLPNSYACMLAWMGLWVLGSLLIDRGAPDVDASALKQLDAIPGNVAAAGLYVYHLVYPPAAGVGPLNQFWSLSVEEQFYGVVSLFVVWMLVSRKRVAWACGVMAVVFVYVGWSRFQFDLGPWPGKLYEDDIWSRGMRTLWTVRPDAFLIGAILAVINAKLPDPLTPAIKRGIVWSGTIGGVVMLLIVTSSLGLRGIPSLPGLPREVKNGATDLLCAVKEGGPFEPCTDRMWLVRWVYTAFSLAIAPYTICLARVKDCGLSRFMSWKPFRFMGERSYSLYIWHLLAYLLAELFLGGFLDGLGISKDGRAGQLASIVGRLMAALVIGFAAHRYIDKWVLRVKLRFAVEDVVVDRRTGEEVAGPKGTSTSPP